MGEPIPGQNANGSDEIVIFPADNLPTQSPETPATSIEENELPPYFPELHSTDSHEVAILDSDKCLTIDLGVPTFETPEDFLEVAIPHEPSSFIVDNLILSDEQHPQGIQLFDISVILGHGVISGGEWKFTNGQGVAETVHALDKLAEKKGYPKVEVVVSCNNDSVGEVVLLDFPQDRPIVYAMGDKVRVTSVILNGKVTLSINTNKFINLDELATYHQVELKE